MPNDTRGTRILLVPAGLIIAKNKPDPNNTLIRCQHARKMWERGRYDYLVVCGGLFMPPDIQTDSAGLIMAQWLDEHGV